MESAVHVQEDLVFGVGGRAKGSIALVSYLGPATFRTCGECSVSKQGDAAIEFQFNRTKILVFGRTIAELAVQGSQKTYHFLGSHEGLMPVRSSTGALTLFVDTERIPKYSPKIDFLATKL
jgi:hypothetical protein